MTPQSSYKIIKEKLPEPYLSLIKKYVRRNNLAKDLPQALLQTKLWHPKSTDEGYYFWEAVYHWSIGERKRLPRVAADSVIRPSSSYDNRYRFCLAEIAKAVEVVEDLFGKIGLSRGNACTGEFNVYKRYLVISHILSIKEDIFTLQMIGEAFAEQLGRSNKFDHATILHAKRNDQMLIETNDPTYCGMKRAFQSAMNGNNDNNVDKMELTKTN